MTRLSQSTGEYYEKWLLLHWLSSSRQRLVMTINKLVLDSQNLHSADTFGRSDDEVYLNTARSWYTEQISFILPSYRLKCRIIGEISQSIIVFVGSKRSCSVFNYHEYNVQRPTSDDYDTFELHRHISATGRDPRRQSVEMLEFSWGSNLWLLPTSGLTERSISSRSVHRNQIPGNEIATDRFWQNPLAPCALLQSLYDQRFIEFQREDLYWAWNWADWRSCTWLRAYLPTQTFVFYL